LYIFDGKYFLKDSILFIKLVPLPLRGGEKKCLIILPLGGS
jgi:hypothetical protein